MLKKLYFIMCLCGMGIICICYGNERVVAIGEPWDPIPIPYNFEDESRYPDGWKIRNEELQTAPRKFIDFPEKRIKGIKSLPREIPMREYTLPLVKIKTRASGWGSIHPRPPSFYSFYEVRVTSIYLIHEQKEVVIEIIDDGKYHRKESLKEVPCLRFKIPEGWSVRKDVRQ